jgi:hypothetical protein
VAGKSVFMPLFPLFREHVGLTDRECGATNRIDKSKELLEVIKRANTIEKIVGISDFGEIRSI